ncbi:uncharacterized protein LOC126565755 [Anopheles maculipalpis]|uniref:uncharacterized protein LOC126565755 n=1 Tax=Anopheles maculipalpis TaxID=1496333 RepID=UPI002159A94C|nr:uncharacterized protein LOC126565755 [Anopheles maculipalpis]
MAVAFVAASEASYLPYGDDLSYQGYGYGHPLSKVVVGSSYGYGLPAAVDKYSYPSYYSSYPAVKNVVEYPSVAPVLATKVVDNSYGLGYNKLVAPLVSPVLSSGYGLGYNKLVAPVVTTKVVDNGLWNYGSYGLGYNKYLSAAPVAKYVL